MSTSQLPVLIKPASVLEVDFFFPTAKQEVVQMPFLWVWSLVHVKQFRKVQSFSKVTVVTFGDVGIISCSKYLRLFY